MKTLYRIVLLAIATVLISSCNRGGASGDVGFAKSTFESLARGDSSVVNHIDWPVFTSQGENIGATYSAITSEVEREQFAENFVTQFATAFRESGGSVDGYSNWRVTAHDSQKTEVAADSSRGVLIITVSERDGVERVSSINVVP